MIPDMNILDITAHRLHNQHLIGPIKDPLEVVRQFGAVQAQDFPSAKWAIGQRCKNVTDVDLTDLYNQGKILRTHILRPTWHFVLPEDIRWMQELTAPRVQSFMKNYYKKVGLDEDTLKSSKEVLCTELKGAQLSRKQVKEVYEQAGIDTSGLRLGFLIIYAELEAAICSGGMQGKQHTYALLDECAAEGREVPRDKALARLAKRFFASHGPATARDFSWWASLTMADARKAAELAGLEQVGVGGKVYYFDESVSTNIPSPIVHLLPNFDEYLVAYKDREGLMQAKLDNTPSYADLSYHVIVCDGQLVGGWKRQINEGTLIVTLNLFVKLTIKQRKALDVAAANLQQFIGMPVVLR